MEFAETMNSLLFISTLFGYAFSCFLYQKQKKYSVRIQKKIQCIYEKKLERKKKNYKEKILWLEKKSQSLKIFNKEKHKQHIQSLSIQISYQQTELKSKQEYLLIKEKQHLQKKQVLEILSYNLQKLILKLSKLIQKHKKSLLNIKQHNLFEIKQNIMENLRHELYCEKEIYLSRFSDDTSIYAEEIAKKSLAFIVQRCYFSHWYPSNSNNVITNQNAIKLIKKIEPLLLQNLEVLFEIEGNTIFINKSSGYNREIARKVIKKIIRVKIIEKKQVEQMIMEEIQKSKKEIISFVQNECQTIRIVDLPSNLAWYMGRLKYRTSFGQNMLSHSFEVAILASLIGGIVGLDSKKCMRSGFLHDIGKSVDHEEKGGHSSIGEQILQETGEAIDVIEGVVEHHEDISSGKPYAAVVNIADAISASRPGARRDTFEKYNKKLEKLEAITKGMYGIEDAYVVSAGREIRVVVNSDKISDAKAKEMAKEIVESVKKEILYSGVIKVIVIREKIFQLHI